MFAVQAQTSLRQQYLDMLEKTETFERYKVIPKTTLDNFYGQVADSVTQGLTTITELRSRIKRQQAQLDSLNASLKSVKSQLAASEKINDTIHFIGIPFKKVGYHLIVWGIILALAGLALIAYFMFIRSNQVTSKSKKELEAIKTQFDAHKDKAREQQVKLKRELQTAVNTIDELKRGKR